MNHETFPLECFLHMVFYGWQLGKDYHNCILWLTCILPMDYILLEIQQGKFHRQQSHCVIYKIYVLLCI